MTSATSSVLSQAEAVPGPPAAARCGAFGGTQRRRFPAGAPPYRPQLVHEGTGIGRGELGLVRAFLRGRPASVQEGLVLDGPPEPGLPAEILVHGLWRDSGGAGDLRNRRGPVLASAADCTCAVDGCSKVVFAASRFGAQLALQARWPDRRLHFAIPVPQPEWNRLEGVGLSEDPRKAGSSGNPGIGHPPRLGPPISPLPP